jgi:hypothetical protein
LEILDLMYHDIIGKSGGAVSLQSPWVVGCY